MTCCTPPTRELCDIGPDLTGPYADLNFAEARHWAAARGGAALLDLPAASFARASTGLAQTLAGDFVSFAAGQPRRTDRGLRAENGSTNAIRRSAFTGGVAGSPGTTPTDMSVPTPAGLARTLAFGSELGLPYMDLGFAGTLTADWAVNWVFDTVAAAAAVGQTWSGGFYARLISGALPAGLSLRIRVGDAANVMLASPQGAISVTSAFGRHAVDGGAVSAAGAAFVMLQAYTASPVPNGSAVNFTLRIYAPQLENRPSMTSPILTTGAAGTRASDVAYVTLPAALGRQTTVFAHLELVDSAAVTRRGIALSDGTAANRINIDRNAAGEVVFATTSGGVAGLNSKTLKAGPQVLKLALVFNEGVVQAYVDGLALGAATAAPMPAGLTRLDLGHFLGANALNGWVRRAAVWRRALSAAEIGAL